MEDDKVQVNVQMGADLQVILDEMVVEDESDRSKFVRKLIRQEYARRLQQQLPLPTEKQIKNKSQAAFAA